MNTLPWSTFVRRIPVKTSIENLYDAWATQEGLEKWFLRKAEFISPDKKLRENSERVVKEDTYTWLWHGWGDDHPQQGTILEANGKDYFQFTFTADCIVTIKLITEKGLHFIELTQSDIPPNDDPKENLHVACSNGWTFYLTNLKSVYEGGLDLRNRDEEIKEVVNA